ncbi:hypothetical protein IFR05_007079 [Cadophora sp. M221]|nr:hypothetical protein IFR05_007079 [Cadophora sp. M221]
MTLPTLRLQDGTAIPVVGFGTGTAWYKEDPNEPFNRGLVEILKATINRGFRHIDGSDAYGTEEEIGVAIKESEVSREEIFVTAKVLEGINDVPAAIKPALNQLEFHPYLQRAHGYLPWMRENGIEVASFNGLTPIRSGSPGPLDEPLARIAKAHGVSENAVLIKWQIEQRVVPVTTTTKGGRMAEYMEAVDLELEPEEIEEITKIGLTHHFRAWAPDRFDPDNRS